MLHNPNKDSIPPELTINSPKQDSIYNNSNINLSYFAEDSIFIDSAKFNLNDSVQNIDCSTSYGIGFIYSNSIQGEIPLNSLNLKEGKNKVIFSVDDIAKPNKNATIKTIDFIIDRIIPTTTITSPINNSYYSSNPNLEVILQDPNLDSQNSYYELNGEKTYFPVTQDTILNYSEQLNSDEGNNNLIVHTIDKAKNISEKEINYTQNIDGIDENSANKNSLEQNFPNPFNNSTTIKYTISKPEKVLLKVYNIQGKELETIVNEYQSPNTYEKNFNATNYSAGTYFYRLTTSKKTEVKMMVKIEY